MGLNDPWDNYIVIIDLQTQKIVRDETNGPYFPLGRLSLDDCLATSKILWGMNPMGRSDPWANYLEIIALQTVKNCKRWTQWVLVPLGPTLLIWLTYSQSISWWWKVQSQNFTLVTTFHKPAGKENMYVQFVYGPYTILNHTQGQVSGSMNADPVNSEYTGKYSTK